MERIHINLVNGAVKMIKILKAGPLMTIQDGGRRGFSDKGVSGSGVLDYRSMTLINILLGNCFDEAVIEMTMMGGDIEFKSETYFALGGSDMKANLSGTECMLYTVYKAEIGNVLTMGYAQSGCHGYIGFSGGIDVPYVMGSKSTNLRCGFGGFQGRKLAMNDILSIGNSSFKKSGNVYLSEKNSENEIRVILCAQSNMFTTKGINDFLSCEYTVSSNYDRMGCRLEGMAVEAIDGMDIISDAILFGTIQISSDGMPIVMLADRQTIGGYAKIGAVATVDIPKFVQHKPGEKIRFIEVKLKEAQKLYKKEQKEFKKLATEYQKRR